MVNINKSASLFLILLIATSVVVMAESALAQSTSKPSIPQFTLKLVPHPYDVPTTYIIDPNTNETITNQGYRVENYSMEVWIKNQPSQNTLFYNVRIKDPNNDYWQEEYHYSKDSPGNCPPQSTSEYTLLSYSVNWYPATDVQVKAIPEVVTQHFVPDHPLAPSPFNQDGHYETRIMMGEDSGWSSTQTISIPDGSNLASTSPDSTTANPTITSAPTSTPIAADASTDPTKSITLPLDTVIIIIAVLALTIVTLSILLFTRHRKTSPPQSL